MPVGRSYGGYSSSYVPYHPPASVYATSYTSYGRYALAARATTPGLSEDVPVQAPRSSYGRNSPASYKYLTKGPDYQPVSEIAPQKVRTINTEDLDVESKAVDREHAIPGTIRRDTTADLGSRGQQVVRMVTNNPRTYKYNRSKDQQPELTLGQRLALKHLLLDPREKSKSPPPVRRSSLGVKRSAFIEQEEDEEGSSDDWTWETCSSSEEGPDVKYFPPTPPRAPTPEVKKSYSGARSKTTNLTAAIAEIAKDSPAIDSSNVSRQSLDRWSRTLFTNRKNLQSGKVGCQKSSVHKSKSPVSTIEVSPSIPKPVTVESQIHSPVIISNKSPLPVTVSSSQRTEDTKAEDVSHARGIDSSNHSGGSSDSPVFTRRYQPPALQKQPGPFSSDSDSDAGGSSTYNRGWRRGQPPRSDVVVKLVKNKEAFKPRQCSDPAVASSFRHSKEANKILTSSLDLSTEKNIDPDIMGGGRADDSEDTKNAGKSHEVIQVLKPEPIVIMSPPPPAKKHNLVTVRVSLMQCSEKQSVGNQGQPVVEGKMELFLENKEKTAGELKVDTSLPDAQCQARGGDDGGDFGGDGGGDGDLSHEETVLTVAHAIDEVLAKVVAVERRERETKSAEGHKKADQETSPSERREEVAEKGAGDVEQKDSDEIAGVKNESATALLIDKDVHISATETISAAISTREPSCEEVTSKENVKTAQKVEEDSMLMEKLSPKLITPNVSPSEKLQNSSRHSVEVPKAETPSTVTTMGVVEKEATEPEKMPLVDLKNRENLNKNVEAVLRQEKLVPLSASSSQVSIADSSSKAKKKVKKTKATDVGKRDLKKEAKRPRKPVELEENKVKTVMPLPKVQSACEILQQLKNSLAQPSPSSKPPSPPPCPENPECPIERIPSPMRRFFEFKSGLYVPPSEPPPGVPRPKYWDNKPPTPSDDSSTNPLHQLAAMRAEAKRHQQMVAQEQAALLSAPTDASEPWYEEESEETKAQLKVHERRPSDHHKPEAERRTVEENMAVMKLYGGAQFPGGQLDLTPKRLLLRNQHKATACNATCHRKCEKLMANLCGINQQILSDTLHALKKEKGQTALAQRQDSQERNITTPENHAAAATAAGSRLSTAGSNINECTSQENSEEDDQQPSSRPTDAAGPPPPNAAVKVRPKFRKYGVEDFNFLKVLGKGSFGKVLLAELKSSKCYYAVKALKKDVVLEDDDIECTMIERKVLALGCKHPFLCHLFCTFQTNDASGQKVRSNSMFHASIKMLKNAITSHCQQHLENLQAFLEESHLFFVMEYLNGGDLMFHIQQKGRFDVERARFYAAEILLALKFLHRKGIVYRDLKLDNLLLDFEGHIRIADFGMCKLQIYLDKTADTFCGTPDYMAPEIIKGMKYTYCVDWWSFGVLLYEMLIGQSPFNGCDEDELFWSICNEQPYFPRFLSREGKHILQLLLEKDPSKRLGVGACVAGDVSDQPFFKTIDFARLEKKDVTPPYKPKLRHALDVSYFDEAFTKEVAKLTPVNDNFLASVNQTQFKGFSYTNPNYTSK